LDGAGAGGVEGGGGVVVGSCGFGGEGSWARFFSVRWACRLPSTGLRCGAAIDVGGRVFGCLGGEVGRFGEWFDIVGVVVVGNVKKNEYMSARSVANARSMKSA